LVKYPYAEGHFVKCPYAEGHLVKCPYAEGHFIERLFIMLSVIKLRFVSLC
jgi:hypothetical protein